MTVRLLTWSERPDPRGRAGELLRGMSELAPQRAGPADRSGPAVVEGPPIERYVTRRREDGRLLDPWMRPHERLGARVATPLPHAMRITGSVAEWEGWTGLAFPDSRDYVFPHGLAPVTVDRAADVGGYWESNVWMVHPELGGTTD